MVYSDTTTKLGLIQDCEQLVFGNYGDISGNSSRLYDFTARLNRAYDKAASKIMACDGRWQFDDTNYTDFPIGTTALVSGQADYGLDVEHLSITKVFALDSSGNKYLLQPIDINDPVAISYMKTPTATGLPTFYDKTGGSVFLFPTPNYSKAAGLIIYYQRKPSYFTYTDTTKSPGVPAIYHRYLSLTASLDYAVSKGLTMKNDVATLVKDMEDDMTEFYSKRSKDESKWISPIIYSSR